MKTILLLLFIITSAITPLLAQVGINTEDPRASLDINGNLKIHNVLTDNTSTAILVLGADSVVHKNTTLLLATAPQSFAGATGATSISLLDISLLSGWYKIQFPTEQFDEHSDYNATTSEFVAPATGIYNIYVQFATSSVISGGEVGVGIFRKPSASSAFSLIAEETFVSINVSVPLTPVNLDVSPPSRKTQRLVKLTQGDTIIFGAKVPLVSATLIGGTKSFFTINQIK